MKRRRQQSARKPETPAEGPRRHGLARWLSKSGLMSRTEAERLVRAGRVTLNGKEVRDPERACHPDHDRIAVDGKPLRAARRVYLAMNKPRGSITTARDPQGRPTAYDLLPAGAGSIQAVGRLDADSSGLLLFTNDTAFAARVTESAGIPKVYRARVAGRVTGEDTRRFDAGIDLDGKRTLPARSRVLSVEDETTLVECEITEGRNRQVRRMWEALGHPVIELERIRIGPVELKGLAPGRTRPLSEYERVLLAIDGPA